MRVLQINKFLYGGAGAETVMFRTAELLRSNGHEVSFFAMQDPRNVSCAESEYFPRGRYYDADQGLIQRVKDAGASIYSVEVRKALRRLVRDRRPDVAHLHNIYHQLTLSVVDELAAQGIPIVMTLHDYKPVCPSYVLYTDHAPCHRCVNGNPAHAIVHRCIKNSRAASAVAATEALLARARGLYGRIDAFISPSRHLADVMVQGGLPASRMHVIPNFVADEQFREPDSRREDDHPMVLFVGRLEEVKGIRVLLDVAREITPAVEVVVVGGGPLEQRVRQAESHGVVRYLGRLDWADIAQLMDRASALVVPSLWEENCPMVVLEAAARGCPVIASNRGGLVELVEDGKTGILVEPGSKIGLMAAISELPSDQKRLARMRAAQFSRAHANYAASKHVVMLTDIYEQLTGAYGSGSDAHQAA